MSEWKEVFQDSTYKFYYWKPETNEVNWCIPDSKWRKFLEKSSGKIYYCHAETGKTVWKLPEGVLVPGESVRASIAFSAGAVTPETPKVTHRDISKEDDTTSSQEGKESPESPTTPKATLTSSSELQADPRVSGLTQTPEKKAHTRDVSMVVAPDKKEFPDSSSTEAQTLKLKGNELFNQKNFAEAKKMYDAAIDLDDLCANFFFNRSATFYCMGDLSNALADARKTVELLPTNASALTRLGFTLLKLDPPDFTGALTMYERALKIDPTNQRISKGLARVNQLKKEYEQGKVTTVMSSP